MANTNKLSYKQKLTRTLGISAWSRDKLADLLQVSNNTFNSWLGGKSAPKPHHATEIDKIYNELVTPLLCDIEQLADKTEERLLTERIRQSSDDNACRGE
jgi:transcriptional regulator with XRE-family HTH domain